MKKVFTILALLILFSSSFSEEKSKSLSKDQRCALESILSYIMQKCSLFGKILKDDNGDVLMCVDVPEAIAESSGKLAFILNEDNVKKTCIKSCLSVALNKKQYKDVKNFLENKLKESGCYEFYQKSLGK